MTDKELSIISMVSLFECPLFRFPLYLFCLVYGISLKTTSRTFTVVKSLREKKERKGKKMVAFVINYCTVNKVIMFRSQWGSEKQTYLVFRS